MGGLAGGRESEVLMAVVMMVVVMLMIMMMMTTILISPESHQRVLLCACNVYHKFMIRKSRMCEQNG